MSETTVETTEEQTPEVESEEVVETEEEFDRERALAKIAKGNSENKGLRAENKELRAAQQELNAIKESQKTEQQKVIERAEQAELDAKTARAELARERIARIHQIPDEDMPLLGNGTEEEIEANAKRVAAKNAAANGTSGSTTPPGQRPAERLRPGATPTETRVAKGVDAGKKLYDATHPKAS